MGERRSPRWVYGEGTEPDYRFSLANERTFLAWIRTSLALLAAGVALPALDLPTPERVEQLLQALLVCTAGVCAALSWLRWARAERAMRRAGPLPGLAGVAIIPGLLVLTAVVVLVAGVS